MVAMVNLTMRQGEARTFTLFAADYSNVPISLTGVSIEWRVGIPPGHPNATWPTFTKTGTATSASNGSYYVSVSAADTQYLRGDFVHQGWVTVSGQTFCATEGRLRIQNWIE